ncbi:Ribonuclease H domain-containing protein [Cinnamomum micranthum f. kanehirae]|uniref:Ribonuclease H domain-containing protein n=1 Tax=Cinnamomum micranthum f. kanehirae TaxID=337451 RepID=A0A443PHS3_9MAGN|nr:Ribonuclease H domain-containing protein [Cinnamomum micranthum f. kanehirae]
MLAVSPYPCSRSQEFGTGGWSVRNCMLHLSSAAAFSQTSHSIMRSSLFGFSSSWKRSIRHAGIKVTKFDILLMRFPVQCYSTRRARASRLPKSNPGPAMEEESKAFYVVRKGDIIGIYRNLDDCQTQVSSSVCDPSVSVYKGYSLSKDAEDYLASRGLKNAIYTISSVDVREDLFGALSPCPFQQPEGPVPSTSKASKNASVQKRPQEDMEMVSKVQLGGSVPLTSKASKKISLQKRSQPEVKLEGNMLSCVLEFDGASKGNPGKAGAGAILRSEDGSVVQNLWQTKNKNMADLCQEAKELKDKFLSFQICHVARMEKFLWTLTDRSSFGSWKKICMHCTQWLFEHVPFIPFVL